MKGFYFDNQRWTIRHLVANTGRWLEDRLVLISPYELVAAIKAEQHLAGAEIHDCKFTRKEENQPAKPALIDVLLQGPGHFLQSVGQF